jgi:t-SNARE complex subunit (syntaxin)
MRILFAVTYLLLLTTFADLGYAFETTSLSQERETVYPHIVEYIDDFTINTNDLESALNNQLHDIKLSDIKTSYAHITNSTVSLSHYGSERRLE